MNNILINCDHCHRDGELDAHDIAVVIINHQYAFIFACPHCGDFNEKIAGERRIGLLRAIGVPVPGDTDEHLVARFAHQLETVDIVAELERTARP